MSGMNAEELSQDRVMDGWLLKLQSELPKIDSAIKNLLAILMAQQPVEGEHYIVPSKAMECGKHILRHLQTYPLLSIDEYCVKFPQSETQSANDRLDEICHYKALYCLREHCTKAGTKVSKTFGRSYFIHTKQWESFKSALLDHLPPKLLLEELQLFLKLFENSIFTNESVMENNQDLIWATDFNSALRARQIIRTKAVTQRVDSVNEAASIQIAEIVESVKMEAREGQPQDDS